MVKQQKGERVRGKRDIAFAIIALMALLPLLLMIVACPSSMCGAALYLQQDGRVGVNGGDQCFLGIVRKGEFVLLSPGSVYGDTVGLTEIAMQAAVSPESEELDLFEYEGRVILVRGHDGGGWIYSATVLVKAGPLLSSLLRLVLSIGAWISAVTTS